MTDKRYWSNFGSRRAGIKFTGFGLVDILFDSAPFALYQLSTLDQAIDHGSGKGIVAQDDLPMAEGSMRGNHDGASFIPIEDHLGAELSPLLAHG